ncbi:hypothetical protein N7478_006105 [Penicillium angulare]|uniref:uncharacterized protein n=1 Tax=Penicillium angulare TaxID=116970 RepID=UPI002540F80D|nr:uncharacterized protein N7478_006105 [Penicillium angulare]KAJ5280733.1 hypothetical protein N7478_006105 [Penicillium angulare]
MRVSATGSAQLTVTTSPTKRRKVSPEPRNSPGGARRHGPSQASSAHPLPPRQISSHSPSPSRSSSVSPPRYVPAHLQTKSFATGSTRSQSGGRSPTPATATAGLTLSSEHSDMQSEPRDNTSPTNGEGRSPSPGDKRPASEIADSDPEGGVSTAVRNEGRDNTSIIDDRVAQVSALMIQPLKDGQKGYVISSTWLKKVFARSSTHADRADKESLESELGSLDNTDIVLDIGPKQDDLKDEQGGLYVPMRPGLQLGEHYEIVPQEAWDLIIKWYGLANGSPVITRFAHETSAYTQSNIIYELNPPIVTIFKLSNPSAGMTPQLLKERSLPPVKALAGRSTNYMKWLKEAKQLAGIDLATKVRVWKISGGIPSANASASSTPAVSRAASPAPASALISSAHKNLLVDLNTFLSLNEGVQRECLQHIKDQTNNSNYNGKMTLIMAGLVETEAVVLEEEIGKGEWVSEASAKTLRNLGIPTEKCKKVAPTPVKPNPAPSGRTSPVPALPRGKKASGNKLGVTGFNNLGNTCYQNAATQCLRAVEELSIFFLNNAHSKDLNFDNPLGYRGELAKAYSGLLHGVYRDPSPSCFNPSRFRNQVGRNNPTMAGWEQQDSQEFLMFVLDGLSEDLNRILKKPYIEKPDSTDEMVHNRKLLEEFATKSWDIYKARNDSVITDLFAGMYKSTLVCPECEKVSIMFDPFSSLTLPIPDQRNIIYREVIYMSLNSKPKRFLVEVDKNGTVQNFKDVVAEKRQVAPERLIGAEVTNGVFWQVFEKDLMSYMELRVKSQDVVTFMELDAPPSDDRILVPVFHRKTQGMKGNKNRPKRDPFAYPTILSFTSEETRDLKAIYSKILKHVATMTTRDILNEKNEQPAEDEQVTEDSDTVVMNEDDARSVDSKIKTSSVEGDDSIVDVSMHDASQSSSTSTDNTDYTDEPPAHPLASSIAQHLLELFDVKYMTSHERIPRGRMMDPIKEQPLITSRLQSHNDDDSSADENSETHSLSDRSETFGPGLQDEPLIRRGEAILIDWNDKGRHALFGGNNNKRDTEQGSPTYSNPEFVSDPEIIRRRAERDAKREEGIALDECLNEFSKDEILSQNDAWYCPRCKEHRQASKKFQLWSAPDILVIHLKRFMQGGSIGRTFRSKLDTLVRFPLEDLDLSDHITGPSDGKPLKYDLIGVDCHSGTMSGGHYYAYAKNWVTGDWCDFNDQHAGIIKNPEKRVTTPAAYLLFYRRQGAGPLGGPEIQKIVNASRNGTEAPVEPQVEESHNHFSERESSEEPEQNPLSIFSEPSWSFNQPNDTTVDNDQNDDGEDLFGDNDSNVAVEDGNSEPGDRLQELDNDGSNFEDVPALLDDASDDELPVVELRVGEEDKV